MFRLFDEHQLRSSRTLEGVWQLTLLDGTERVFPAIVPGIWEAIPALAQYRGKARYERTFVTEKDGNLLLRFGGVIFGLCIALGGWYLSAARATPRTCCWTASLWAITTTPSPASASPCRM